MAPAKSQKRSASPLLNSPRKKLKDEYSDNPSTMRERERRARMDERREAADKARKARNQRKQRAIKRAKQLPGFEELSSTQQEREIEREFEEGEEKYKSSKYFMKTKEAGSVRRAEWRKVDADPRQRPALLAQDDERWKGYRAHWKRAILSTMTKLRILDQQCIGGELRHGNKAIIKILVLMGLPLISRHSGLRPEVRSAFNFRGVLFKSQRSEYARRGTQGFMRRSRPVVRFEHRIRRMKEEAQAWGSRTTSGRPYCSLQRLRVADEVFRAVGALVRGTFGPHHLFTKVECAVFRNMAAHCSGFRMRGGWIQLPGPAWLWPKHYDFEKHGLVPERDAIVAKALFDMVYYGNDETIPPGFFNVVESYTDFRMVSSSEENTAKHIGSSRGLKTWASDLAAEGLLGVYGSHGRFGS